MDFWSAHYTVHSSAHSSRYLIKSYLKSHHQKVDSVCNSHGGFEWKKAEFSADPGGALGDIRDSPHESWSLSEITQPTHTQQSGTRI
jgi:hypothetical protein